MYRLIFCLLIVLVSCGTEDPQCVFRSGEYVAWPKKETASCFLPRYELPEKMFLDTEDLLPEYQVCGYHVLLDSITLENGCKLHQKKSLTIRKESVRGNTLLEVDCGSQGSCKLFWILKFRRIENEK